VEEGALVSKKAPDTSNDLQFWLDVYATYRPKFPMLFPWQVAICERYGITRDDLTAMGYDLIDPLSGSSDEPEALPQQQR
jgi:hypothetical protein